MSTSYGRCGRAPLYNSAPLREFPGPLLNGGGPISVRDTVTTRKNGTLQLTHEIGAGGEGTVFATNRHGVLAKVYKPARLTTGRKQKLDLMVARGLGSSGWSSSGICWPEDVLEDGTGEFRGYLMPQGEGRSLGKTLFIRSELQVAFPQWNRAHLATLGLSVLERVQALHREGVIIGDINPENFLVKDERTVFFVDTDSYQLSGYPCPVGTVHFTPPELQGANFSSLLRTREHENFAVATLLFMIVLLGKQPYACRGGGSPTENIRRREFPYPLGAQSRGAAPEGSWRYIWSHLPFKIKEAFFETFDVSCASKPRRSVSDWILLFRRYDHALREGYVSDELFPTDLKKVSEHARALFGAQENRPKRASNSGSGSVQERPVISQAERGTGSPLGKLRSTLTQSGTRGSFELPVFLKKLFR